MEMRPLVYRGTKEICAALGLNPKRMSHFVSNKKLPAWKIDGEGQWMALPADLQAWATKQKEENLK